MYSLDKKQVEIIVADVQLAAITLSHLADDLVDHICCEVESLVAQGNSFEQAYEVVKKQSGIEVLQKIQDNTKFLIDKNYRLMKTTMKITGNISLAMLGIGTIFKIMHWAGASVLLVIGFFVLCAIFFPIAVHTNYKKSDKKQNLFLHIAILIGGIFFMSGVLFKIMHWPGAALLLLIGYLVLLCLYLPILLVVNIRKE
jgi:integral membrane sensor domain MASE1